MKKCKKVQFVSLFLALMLVMYSLTFSSIALEQSSPSNLVTIEQCYIAGQKWIAANCDNDTIVESVIPIKSLDEELNGYCINFSKNGVPNGYLVIDAHHTGTNYIREFALDGLGLYALMSINSGSSTMPAEQVIYSTDLFQYAIKIKEKGIEKYYNTNGVTLTVAEQLEQFPIANVYARTALSGEVSLLGVGTYQDAFFDGSSLTSYTAANDCIITGASTYWPYKMKELDGVGRANCGPTAVTNILGLMNERGLSGILLYDDIFETYNQVVLDMNFNPNTAMGTTYANVKNGIQEYVQDRGFLITLSSLTSNAWSEFKRCADSDRANLIFIQGDDDGLLPGGHFLVGIGYRIMNDGTKYLRVIDGWRDTVNRFMQFDSSLIYDIHGTRVHIRPQS